MITVFAGFDKDISQDFYDEVMDGIQIEQVPCPCCHHRGCLIFWGTYKRTIKTDGYEIVLVIRRVLCRECARQRQRQSTHALLLSNMVPCSQIPLTDQADIIDAAESGNRPGIEGVLERNPLIDMNYVCRLLAIYRAAWMERLRSEGIPLRPCGGLCASCFRSFSRQFMQIKTLPNCYFRPPT